MAENLSIARPYARAVFAEALSENQLKSWSELLSVLSMIAQDERMKGLLKDPQISKEKLQAIFCEIGMKGVASASEKIKSDLNNLIKLLIENERLDVLSEIAFLFNELVREQEDLIDVEVISAWPLDSAHKASLKEKLEKRLQSKVVLNCSEDTALMGGAIIRTNDWIIDGSVKGKLVELEKMLMA